MEKDTIYKKQSLNPGDHFLADCGNIHLGLQREKDGWFIRVFEKNGEDAPVDPAEIGAGEYFHSGKSNSFVIAPALQAKPLVFKGTKIIIAPRQRLTFFLKVPLLLQVYYSKIQDENLLKEVPSKRLSDTWFGEPDNGVPAFALGSEYFLSFAEIETSPFEAICPVTIYNNWDQLLEVERLIVKVDNLTLFRNGDRVVTNVVKLEYKGKDAISGVSYGTAKQFHGENPETLAKARSNDLKSLLKANFHFIRNIYNRFE